MATDTELINRFLPNAFVRYLQKQNQVTSDPQASNQSPSVPANPGANGKSFLDVNVTSNDQITNAIFQSVANLVKPAAETSKKWIIIPSGNWKITEPLIIPRFFSVYFEPGAKLTAQAGFSNTGVSDGKTVSSVLSGPTDSSNGYWESCQIVNPHIDANGLALSCIELWRHRFCEIINSTLWNGLNHGLKLNLVSESTSYELTLEGCRIYNQKNVLNVLGAAGLEIQKCTDLEIRNTKIIGYDYGIHEDSNSGSNFYNTVHVWNRPTQGSLHRAFWFQGNSGTAYGLYADTPVARSTTTPTLVDNSQDSYGVYVEGSGWTFNSLKVYVNNALDGNGYDYGGDNQTTGIYWASTAGSGYMDGCQFIGADATHRLKSAIGGPNKGSPSNISPRYQNCSADARYATFQQGTKFKSQGGPSFDFVPTDFDDGTGFGNLSVVLGAFPSPNGIPNAAATRQVFYDFGINTGTTGKAGIRIWDFTSDGGSNSSKKIAHQLSVNGIGWLAHATTGSPIQIVVGRQSSASTQAINGSNLSSRASTAKSVFDFQAPVTFGQPIHFPQFTTAQRDALGTASQAASIIYNTTNTQWETTEDGTTWSPLGTNREVVNQAAHGFAVGEILRATNTGYVRAQADSVANSKGASGRVSSVIDANTFILQDAGLSGSGFAAGTEYWLSATTSGALQTTAPTLSGQVRLPIGVGTPSGKLRLLIHFGSVNP